MSDIRWMGLTHEQIHNMINAGPGAGASDVPADFWGTLKSGLNEISGNLHNKLSTLNVNWEGASSDQALAGMTPLKDWAGKAETGSGVMQQSFELQGNYVASARAEVPPPKKVTTPEPSGWQAAAAGAALITGNPGPAAAVAAQAIDHESQERASDEAARKAVQAMEKYESSSEWNADTLGHFQDPPKLVVDTPPPNPAVHQGSVDQSGMYNTTGVHNNQQTSANQFHTSNIGTQQTTQPHITPNQPPPFTPPQHTTPVPPPTTTPNQHIPTPTPTPPPKTFPAPTPPPGNPGNGPFTPGTGPFYGGQSGYDPNRPGSGRSPFGSGPGQGGQGGGGRGGAGGSGNAFGQNSSMDPEGRQGARPGASSVIGEGPGGRGGMGGNLGGGGRGANGPMGGAGQRANGEEDEEHETPDYLLETEDVFGDERLIAPSVIGEKPEQR